MNEEFEKKPIETVEVEAFRNVAPTENPLAGALDIQLSVPEIIDIKMVHAAALNDYEVLLFISSLIGSAFTGFLVAFIQSFGPDHVPDWSLCWMAVVWLLVLVVTIWMAVAKRKAIRRGSKVVRLKATQVQVKPPHDPA